VKETFAAGDTIIKEGFVADSLYFLVAGSINVCVAREDNETVTALGVCRRLKRRRRNGAAQ
jgi:hypothetical protein